MYNQLNSTEILKEDNKPNNYDENNNYIKENNNLDNIENNIDNNNF